MVFSDILQKEGSQSMRGRAKKLILFFMFTFIAFFLSYRANAEEEPKVYRLPVIETSDIHGYLADDSGENVKYRMAWIADKIKDVRGSRYDTAVVLDGGDIYQGNIMSSFYQGSTTSLFFEKIGYDAVTIGNHEFDWDLDTVVDPDGTMRDYSIGELKGENHIPVVISNLYKDGEDIPELQDYIILDKVARDDKGNELNVKVGVIGIAGDYGFSVKEKHFGDKGYSIVLDFDKVNALAAELEGNGECDVTILLAHEMPKTIAEGLGEGTKIDLVLGGHDHKRTNNTTEWGLPYMEPVSNARAYAYSELTFSENEGKAVFDKVENAQVSGTSKGESETYNIPENVDQLDQELVETTDYIYQNLKKDLKVEIGYITESAERYVFIPGSGDRSDYADNWITSIINRASGSEVTFLNGAKIGFPLPEGSDRRTIYLSDIYEMFAFSDSLYIFRITYGDLIRALEYSFTPRGKYLLKSMVGIECHYNSGKVVSLVRTDGECIFSNGVWKDGWENKELLVTVNEYIATNERPNYNGGTSNPFYEWNKTGKMINDDLTDQDAARDFLIAEAAANDGYLYTDRKPYYIYEEPSVAKKPVAKNPVYNGSLQDLVTSGEATAGEMYYTVGMNNIEPPEFDGTSEAADKKWNKEIPQGKDPGIYYVWYMVKGYDGKETKPICIPVTIKEADPEIPVVEMQRLYNPNSGEHFYTASKAEKENLVKAGWKYEGLAWNAPKKSKTPVYRLYNPNAGDHHYTMSRSEKDNLVKAGWRDEGIGWYSDDAKTVAVYRAYNPNAVSGAHHFTVSKAEIKDIVAAGWKDEGIGWYGK